MRRRSTAGTVPPSRPPTARTTATTAADEGASVVALLPARGQGRDVGVVSLDVDSGHVQLTQFADSPTWVRTLHLCRTRSPKAIVLPQSALSGTRTDDDEPEGTVAASASTTGTAEAAMLVQGLRAEFPDMPIVGVLRKC